MLFYINCEYKHVIMKRFLLILLLSASIAQAQQLAPLTVQKIMRDPKWMGTSPSNYRWSANSRTVYFKWNPEAKEKDAQYKVSVNNAKPQLTDEKEAAIEKNYVYNKDKSLWLYEKGGDIYFYNFKTKKEQRLTNTLERESGAYFLYNNDIVFQKGDNLFQLSLNTNELKQLTNFVKGKRQVSETTQKTVSAQDTWLKTDQTELFDIIKKRNKQGNNRSRRFGQAGPTQQTIKPIYLEDNFLSALLVSPTGRYISYRLTTPVTNNHNTIVPNYVTSSGYTEDIFGRTKVGEN